MTTQEMVKTVFIALELFFCTGNTAAARIPADGTDGVDVGRCVERVDGIDGGTGGAAAERGGCGTMIACLHVGQLICTPA